MTCFYTKIWEIRFSERAAKLKIPPDFPESISSLIASAKRAFALNTFVFVRQALLFAPLLKARQAASLSDFERLRAPRASWREIVRQHARFVR